MDIHKRPRRVRSAAAVTSSATPSMSSKAHIAPPAAGTVVFGMMERLRNGDIYTINGNIVADLMSTVCGDK